MSDEQATRIRELEAVVARYKTVTADGKTAYEQDSVWMVHFDGRITEVTVVHYTHYYSEDEVSRDDVPCNCYSTYEAAKAAAAKHQGGEA